MNNYDYPMGADNGNAPWNKEDIDVCKEDVDVIATQTLSIKETIQVDPNADLYDEWVCASYTIQELLGILREYLKEDLNSVDQESPHGKYLKKLMNICDGWEVVNTEIEKM